MMVEKGSIKLEVLEGIVNKTRNQTLDEVLDLFDAELGTNEEEYGRRVRKFADKLKIRIGGIR